MIESLEILYSKDGKPLKSEEVLDFGQYDVALGMEKKFYMRNPNKALVADISSLNTSNPNSAFYGPELIKPLETVECTISIHANSKPMLDNFDFLKEDSGLDHDIMEGTIRWSHYKVPGDGWTY